MSWRTCTRAIAAAFVLVCTSTTPLLGPAELNGAWKMAEASGYTAEGEWESNPVQPGLYIFQDGYYSIMYVRGSEARPLMAEDATRVSITDEQMRSIFMPFVANSGTYEVDGSTLVTKPMVALWPNFMEGGEATYTYGVEGNDLHLSAKGEDWEWKIRLERLR